MNNNDNIKELFSKSFEEHRFPVREELWKGVQSKMAAAGVTSVAATKTISLFTKLLIGTAVVSTGVVTALFVGKNESASTETAPKKPVTTEVNKSVQTPSKVAVKQSEVENKAVAFDYDLFMDTLLYKPFCLVKGPVSTDDISPVLEAATDVVAENSTTPIAVAETITKEPQPATVFQENTDKPVSAVLASELTKFPNFFSPNNDGNNDEYFVEIANKEQIKSFLVQIFNVQNKLVFQSNDPDFKWNGEYNGETTEGIYFCLVTIIDNSGKVIKDKQLIEAKK
uniref:T9SS type B sorting domain-containing protein n=1 Tax=Fluviicola sp. TaxID=1917219 RepID=UPI00404A1B4D